MNTSVTMESITPSKAEKILNANTCNRALRAGLVELSYFMRGKSLTVIKKIADEVYPLPKAKKAK